MDGVVDGDNPRRAIVEGRRDAPGVPPVVGGSHLHAQVFVGGPHEFTPAHDLSNKAFQGVEGDVVLLGVGDGFFHHKLLGQQADVEGR